MKDVVKDYLNKLGYSVNEDALKIISLCEDWYANKVIEDFHRRKTVQGQEYTLNRMNFAKRCCADDANLCEIVSVAPEKESALQPFIDDFLGNNRFDVKYREQLEKTSAAGTVGAYIYLKDAQYLSDADGNVKAKGGEIKINYVESDCIIPLTIENDLITECAFCATNTVKGKEKTTLVIFTAENGLYKAETVVFNAEGKRIDDESTAIQLGDIKPFAIMKNAEVNNLDDMEGYGLPKIYNAIPMLKAMDLCYNVLFSDLDKAEKILLVNELLCEFDDRTGKPRLTPEQKKIFMFLGEKLPNEKEVIQEYNPEIRIEQITKSFELVLSLLSMSFGYGTKKYTFENGKITTATEYIGEKQDAMQELNKQRKNATDYITDIIHAAVWFSNQFSGTSYNVEEALSIEFDDSYIEDKTVKLESMRDDALSFDIPKLTVWYLMEAYNLSEQEAAELVEQKMEKEATDTDGDDED